MYTRRMLKARSTLCAKVIRQDFAGAVHEAVKWLNATLIISSNDKNLPILRWNNGRSSFDPCTVEIDFFFFFCYYLIYTLQLVQLDIRSMFLA